MLYRECTVAGVTLSGDTEKTRLVNGTDKVIECEICRHAEDGTALDLTDKDDVVTRKWEWTLAPGAWRSYCRCKLQLLEGSM